MPRKKSRKTEEDIDENEKDRRLHSMHNKEKRLATFEDWPFKEDSNCTSDKMAAAGFFFCPTDNEPDLVRCYLCQKELDGWEPTDDPWEEHKSHSGHCPFLKVKDPDNLTLVEFLKLELERQKYRIKKEHEASLKEFKDYASNAKHELETLGNSQ